MGDQEGLVLQGCGGDLQEWVDGINEILAQEQEHGVMSYDALDNAETVGQENIADAGSPGLEENIIAEELRSRVRHAVAALPKAERELIQAIYYEGLSERVYAKQHGISQRGANKQRRKILSKLKMFLDFMGIF